MADCTVNCAVKGCAANNTEHTIKLLESLRGDLQGLIACVRGENRHAVVCMLEKLEGAIVCLNEESESD